MITLGTPVPETGVYDGKGEAPLPVFFSGPTLLVFFRGGGSRSGEMLRWAAGANRFRLLTVIGVSQETIEDTATFLQEAQVRLPVVIDDRPFPASQAFGFETVPAAALIEDDLVAWTSDGCTPGDLAELHERVARLTGDAGVAAPVLSGETQPSRHLES